MTVVWVALGGAVGSAVRYLIASAMVAWLGPAFPFGTMLVNVLGSGLLAAVMRVGLDTTMLSTTLRLALTTGVLGGFTTYSTFSYETLQLLQTGATATAFGYVAGTVCGCLLACAAGWHIAGALIHAS